MATPENKSMQKLFFLIVMLGLITGGCRTTKKTQHVVSDSAVSVSPATTLKPVDSAAILKEQLTNNINTPLDFTTFYGNPKIPAIVFCI